MVMAIIRIIFYMFFGVAGLIIGIKTYKKNKRLRAITKCDECGNELKVGEKICSKCGNPINNMNNQKIINYIIMWVCAMGFLYGVYGLFYFFSMFFLR